MILTDRDRQIVAAVANFGILTREQIAMHLRFGSVTRANAVLLRLTRHQYLARRLQPSVRGTRRLTYVLGSVGAELLGYSQKGRDRNTRRRWVSASDLFVEHQLAVNDVRLLFQHLDVSGYEFTSWRTERQLALLNVGVVPDGYCEYRVVDRSYGVFVEVDNGTESQSRWRQKVTAYLALAFGGKFTERFHRQFFRVLVTAPSERRLTGIAREIARRTDQIFWLALQSDLLHQGPLAHIWRRPTDSGPYSLINPTQP
jgi:hypothetical protein